MSCFSCNCSLKLGFPSGKVLRSLNKRSVELGAKLLPVAPEDLICASCTNVWESFDELEGIWPIIMKRFQYNVVNMEIEAPPVHVPQNVTDPKVNVNRRVPVESDTMPNTTNESVPEENIIVINNCDVDIGDVETDPARSKEGQPEICNIGKCENKNKSYIGPEMTLHMIKHHKHRSNCCGITFPSKDDDYKLHFRGHKKDMNVSPDKKEAKRGGHSRPITKKVSNRSKCPMQGCSSHLQIASLFNHLKVKHSLSSKEIAKLQLQISCEVCGKMFIVTEYACRI